MNQAVMNAPVVLKAQGLVKQFGGITATDNVNLELRLGARHALIGPNGAGKTTLIGAVCGLVRPTGGTIRAFGLDMAGDWRRARGAQQQRPVQRGLRTMQIDRRAFRQRQRHQRRDHAQSC